jgi:membrane protein DedA with SNARE-associated domain
VTAATSTLASWTIIAVDAYPGGARRLCHDRRVVSASAVAPHVLPAADHARVVLQHGHHHIRHPSIDYVGLAAAAAASWIGVPCPGEPVLIAAGVLAAQHRLPLVPVLLVAWVAATAGGVIGWLIGLKAGRALVTGPGPLRSQRVRAASRGEELFARHPVIGILLTPSWIAGIHRVRPVTYQLVNAAAAAVWAGGVGLGAYLVGPAVIDVVDDVGTVTAILLVVAIVAAVALGIRRRRRHRREG